MSIFNAGLERNQGGEIKCEDAILFFHGIEKSKRDDIIRSLLKVHCNTEFLQPLLENQSSDRATDIRNLVCLKGVNISEEKPTYFEKLKSDYLGKDIKKEDCAQYPLLGEFIPSEPSNVNLYYYNILDCAEKDGVNYLIVLRYVYLHELMHKYFYKINPAHKYIPEEEEPMAEFGALFCLDLLVENGIADKSELDWALKHVKNKDGLLKHYSYGEELYRQYKAGDIELKSELESFKQ